MSLSLPEPLLKLLSAQQQDIDSLLNKYASIDNNPNNNPKSSDTSPITSRLYSESKRDRLKATSHQGHSISKLTANAIKNIDVSQSKATTFQHNSMEGQVIQSLTQLNVQSSHRFVGQTQKLPNSILEQLDTIGVAKRRKAKSNRLSKNLKEEHWQRSLRQSPNEPQKEPKSKDYRTLPHIPSARVGQNDLAYRNNLTKLYKASARDYLSKRDKAKDGFHYVHSPTKSHAEKIKSQEDSLHLLGIHISNQSQDQKKRHQNNQENSADDDNPFGIPKPMLHQRKPDAEDSSESGEDEVPLAFYQKQYKAMLKDQCLEEMNFLYFGQNSSNKEWTQGMLSLLEKHDKELASLRRKCKYLEKFDEAYFATDIYMSPG